MRVLIVEDSVAQAESLALLLRSYGHTAYHAPTALGAQILLDAHQPDAIVLDLVLPAINGGTFLEWLRARPETAAIPVVVTTGLPRDEVRHLEGVPNVTVLTKPCDPRELLRALGVLPDAPESER